MYSNHDGRNERKSCVLEEFQLTMLCVPAYTRERRPYSAPFTYRGKSHFMFLFRYGSSNGCYGHINISSSAPDWPRTIQKHLNISTTLKQVYRQKKGVNKGVLPQSTIEFWYQQFYLKDRRCTYRHIFQTYELIAMYLCSEGRFGLQRSCTEIRRPTFWFCRGSVQTQEPHRKCHKKVTTHI